MVYTKEDYKRAKPLLRSLNDMNDNNRGDEPGIHHTNKDFDEFVQDDRRNEQQPAIHHSNHEDFDKRVQQTAKHQNQNHNENDNDNLQEQPAIHHNHEDFDKRAQQTATQPNQNTNNKFNINDIDLVEARENNEDNVMNHNKSQPPEHNRDVDKFRNDIMNHNIDNVPEDSGESSLSLDMGYETAVPLDTIAGNGTSADAAALPPTTAASHTIHRNAFTFGAIGAVSLVILVLAFRLMTRRRNAKKRLSRDVYSSIAHFDVEDIDLTRAVTGGWHGTYKNHLKDGQTYSVDTDDTDDEDFDIDLSDGFDDEGDGVIDASRRSTSSDDNMIVFMEEGDDKLFVADRNIYFSSDIDYDDHSDYDDDDIYYASDDNLFAPVRSRTQDII